MEGKAIIIPGRAQIEAAGAPVGASPDGQEVPLFGCLHISRPGTDGVDHVLPLFASRIDAEETIANAVAMTEGETADGLDIM